MAGETIARQLTIAGLEHVQRQEAAGQEHAIGKRKDRKCRESVWFGRSKTCVLCSHGLAIPPRYPKTSIQLPVRAGGAVVAKKRAVFAMSSGLMSGLALGIPWRNISVSTLPGQIAFTETLAVRSSSASARVRPITPCFAAQ